MSINTFSAFFYGHTVTIDNQIIPLDEGSGEIAVEIPVGSYSLTDFIVAVNAALNLFGTQEYTVSVDRSTRFITISAASNFSLLFNSSSNASISLAALLGFDSIDLTGVNSYTGTSGSGSVYFPQFKLQNFVDFDFDQKANNVTVNQTASGKVEVIKYANNKFMSCDFSFITNITPQTAIRNNPTGVEDALAFIEYATTKADLEFVPDESDFNTFTKCILEETSNSRTGTDFILKELYGRGLTGYFELNRLKFRRID